MLINVCEREGISIAWNKRVLKYEEKQDSVEVIFENGERREFDILIGGKISRSGFWIIDSYRNVMLYYNNYNYNLRWRRTFYLFVILADGIQSPIRAQLVGDELNYTGYTCFTGVTRRSEAPEAFDHQYFNRNGVIAMSPERTAFMFHHNEDELLWIFTVKVPMHYFEDRCGLDRQKWKEEIVARTGDIAPLFKTYGSRSSILTHVTNWTLWQNTSRWRAYGNYSI